jgi:mono/diheme cytochrome c family protein
MAKKIFAGLVILLYSAASGAQAQEIGNAEAGLRIAQDACAECHLVVKAVGRSNNPNAPTFEAIARTPGLTRAALAAALQTSHNTMPNFMSYILSLKE